MIPFSASKLIIIMRINKIIAKFITFNGKASMLPRRWYLTASQSFLIMFLVQMIIGHRQEDECKLKVITPNEIF